MTLQQFAHLPSVGEKAERLSYHLLFGPELDYAAQLSRPFGVDYSILGVGLINFNGEDAVVVFVDSTTTLPEGERLSLLKLEIIRDALHIVFGDNIDEWKDSYAVGVVTG